MNFNLPLGINSFVPFKAFRLDNPKVLWINLSLYQKYGLFLEKDCVDDDVILYTLEQFAYSTLSNPENENSVFYAERYGGQGISYNGGGARAGIKGCFQVKGIGPTPLVGKKSPFWYSNGQFPVSEAIKEVMCSEVLNYLLPHGAVQCLAIIESDIDAFSDINKQKVRCKGGLVVRENALRVAHFERASLFTNQLDNCVSDYERTEQAVNQFLTYLEMSETMDIVEYLECSVVRWAQQIASARANSIMHGSLSSSNMCIDGRWIDFGTTTSATHYTNVIAAIGSESFWNEHYPLFSSIHELVFHINKFSRNKVSVDGDKIAIIFSDHLERELKRQFLLKLGLSREQVESLVDLKQCEEFFDNLLSVIKLGKMEIHAGVPYFSDNVGKYTLPKIIDILLSKKIINGLQEKQLMESFDGLITAYCKKYMMTYDQVIKGMKEKTSKYYHNFDFLHFDIVQKEVEEMASKGIEVNDVCNYINSKISISKLVKENNED